MLLDAVLIVLRETLEAGVLVSVLLSLGNLYQLKRNWLWSSLIVGGVSAFFYASQLGVVSEWFDYVGQEVVNASFQYGLYLCLLCICFLISSTQPINKRLLRLLLGAAVVLAVIREGTEVIIFFTGFLSDGDVLVKAITSGFIGLMIGFSVGALCYYLIVSPVYKNSRILSIGVLVFVAAGMVAQATQLLIQADWLPSSAPLWDSSSFLPEASTMGQLAYAVFGYEASPTLIEVVLYFTALLLIPCVIFLRVFCSRKLHSAGEPSL